MEMPISTVTRVIGSNIVGVFGDYTLATEPSNEDIATKFEQEYVRCVRNEEECVCSALNCCDTEQQYPH